MFALDLIDSKVLNPPRQNIFEIPSGNKTIEEINLSRIFHDLLVKAALPNTCSFFDTPAVAYTLSNPIKSKIYNFDKFVKRR